MCCEEETEFKHSLREKIRLKKKDCSTNSKPINRKKCKIFLGIAETCWYKPVLRAVRFKVVPIPGCMSLG